MAAVFAFDKGSAQCLDLIFAFFQDTQSGANDLAYRPISTAFYLRVYKTLESISKTYACVAHLLPRYLLYSNIFWYLSQGSVGQKLSVIYMWLGIVKYYIVVS